MNNEKFHKYHMKVAEVYSELSSAERRKVGAILVKENRIISIGYNGTPSGWDNACEEKVFATSIDVINVKSEEAFCEKFPYLCPVGGRYRLKTKEVVLHAELNCLMKICSSNESSTNSVMYVTCEPCLSCAKAIYQAGIKEVYYKDDYHTHDGILFLEECGCTIRKLG